MRKTIHTFIVIFLAALFVLTISDAALAQNSEMERYQAALMELKKTQKQIQAKLSDEELENFVSSQRDWHKFKNSDCLNVGLNPLICLESRTKERVQHLKDYLKGINQG